MLVAGFLNRLKSIGYPHDSLLRQERAFVAVSIRQIAENAGVSEATVSMALRDNPLISATRRKLVRQLAKEMGYQPNALARGLAGGRTKSVGVLLGLSLGAPSTALRLVQNIACRVNRRGYVTSIADNMVEEEVFKRLLRDYAQRRMDGIVFQNGNYRPLEEWVARELSHFPAVVLLSNKNETAPFDQIVQDREPAIKAAVEYLAGTGRTRPILAGVHPPKAEVYIRHFRTCGVEIPPEAVMEQRSGNYKGIKDLGGFYEALQDHLGREQLPMDVMICNNDDEAAVAIEWMRSKGIRIPEDVAVVGFNDSEISKFLFPRLASIARREDDIVVEAIEEMLFSRLENRDLPTRCVVVPMEFVWRESAGLLKPDEVGSQERRSHDAAER